MAKEEWRELSVKEPVEEEEVYVEERLGRVQVYFYLSSIGPLSN